MNQRLYLYELAGRYYIVTRNESHSIEIFKSYNTKQEAINGIEELTQDKRPLKQLAFNLISQC